MSASTDPDHFFQTTNSLAETNRKTLKSHNKHGNPIRLPSKILAIVADPYSRDAVYVAESAGTARRVVLETGEKSHLYQGPSAPLTSLALHPGPKPTTLYAGCWDKTIWSWDIPTRTQKRQYHGHTDFVKALLCLQIQGTTLLLSGGADAKIIILNADSGDKLYILHGHVRGILALAIDPTTLAPPSPSDPNEPTQSPQTLTLFSAASSPELLRWHIPLPLPSSPHPTPQTLNPALPLLPHETSINALVFSSDDDNELWTASSDGTAKCLSRERGWEADTVLAHGDYVRGVAVDEAGGQVVTVGRDEDVKVWERGGGGLVWVYRGHWEEVTGCVVLGREVVTGGIDGTVRRWGLSGEAIGRARREKEEGDEGGDVEEEGDEKVGGMTEEEERELAELMDE